MTECIIVDRPAGRQWLNKYINPGPQGSIGGVNMTPRLAQSTPSMPMRWQLDFAHKKAQRIGSNVSDGSHASYDSGGGPARVVDTDWFGQRDFKTSNGWIYQDLLSTDRAMEPTTGELPSYSWRNKIATNYNSRHTGDLFLPLPGPYAIGEGQVPVGGNGPVITNVIKPLGYPAEGVHELGLDYDDNASYNAQDRLQNMKGQQLRRQAYLNGEGPQTSRQRRSRF